MAPRDARCGDGGEAATERAGGRSATPGSRDDEVPAVTYTALMAHLEDERLRAHILASQGRSPFYALRPHRPRTHSHRLPPAGQTRSLHISTTLYLSPIPSSLSAPRVSKLPTPPPKYAFYIGSPASQRCRKALEAAGWKVGTMWPARRIVTNEKSFSGALGTV